MNNVKTWLANGLTMLAVGGFVAGLAMTLPTTPAEATAAFAQQTGKACGVCHQNPAGGGKLKKAGEDFKAGKK